MKKIISTFSIVLAFACAGFAQQKYGHINSEEIVVLMPEYKQMSGTLEKKQKALEVDMQGLYSQYQTKQKELSDFGKSMMEAVLEEKLKELEQLQKKISSFEDIANQEIQTLQSKLLKPINDKYLKVVQQVAKENGYTYIFDLASPGLAYYPENNGDISALVKSKLGIN